MSDMPLQTESKKYVKKSVIIVLSVTAVLILALFLISLYIVSADKNVIYKNIYINETKIGGMTADEAASLLEEKYNAENIKLKFSYNNKVFEIPAKKALLNYKHFDTVMDAYELGKEKGFFKSIFGAFKYTFKKHILPIKLSISEDKLYDIINENVPDAIDSALKTKVVVEGENLAITNGFSGRGVDIDKLKNKIISTLSRNADTVYEIIVEECKPLRYSAKRLYDEFHKAPSDAVFSLPPNKIGYKDSVNGIDFDIKEAEKILLENENNTQTYYIPIKITKPEKNDDWFIDNYGEIMGTFTTKYNASVTGRCANIDLAAGKIDGMILKPGERFSFNDVVGPRNSENGFQTAKVYQAGEVVDGIGGGICQVSSTLFNAIVYADLEIVYRTNHSMPVSYVPEGRDATVSYGQIDFVFANNQPYPVRLSAKTNGSSITCSVKGLKFTDKKVEITTEKVGTTAFKEKTIEDKNLASGKKKIEKKGVNGSIVNTYKTVYENGEKSEAKLIARSNYIPTDQVVVIGTKKTSVPITIEENTVSAWEQLPEDIELNGEYNDFEAYE